MEPAQGFACYDAAGGAFEMRLRLILACAIVALLLGACGGTSSPPASNTSPSIPTLDAAAEQALAESMLLKLSDFPSGTTETPATPPGADDPIAACNPQHPPGSTGFAAGATFSRDGQLSDVEEQIYVFPSAEGAAAWSVTYRSTVVACVVDVINSGKANTDGTKLHDAAVKDASFPAPEGSELKGYRLEFSGDTSPTSTSQVIIDGAVVTIGRVVVVISGGPFGFSSADFLPYLNRAAEIVHQKLGQ